MRTKWKDISSYSRGDRDRTPHSWECKVAGIRLVVTRHIHHDPSDWLVRCGILPERVLKSKDIDDAKAEALAMLRSAAQQIVDGAAE